MVTSSAEYNEIIEKISECFDEYNIKRFDNNRFSLSLANGDYITIRIPKNMVAHLLGINVDYLRSTGSVKMNLSAYDSLGKFLENSFQIGQNITHDIIKKETLFSKYINEKLEAFSYNINIRTDDIYCIVKYDREKTYKLEEVAEISDYYIVRKNPRNQKLYVLGLVKSEYANNVYVPSTSRMYNDFSKFTDFMSRIAQKQEITYPYVMKVDNQEKKYQSSFILKTDDKKDLLDNTLNRAKKYGSTAAVGKDFSFTLAKSIIQNTNANNIISILKLLSENIKNGNILEQNEIDNLYGDIELPREVLELIGICNDVVLSKNASDGSAALSYSNLNDENISLKNEVQMLKEEVSKYKTEIKSYEEKCIELESENELYEKQKQIIEEAYQKVKSIKQNKVR